MSAQLFFFLPQGNVPDGRLIRVSDIFEWDSDDRFDHYLTNYFNLLAAQRNIGNQDIIEENIRRFRRSLWEVEAFCYGEYCADNLQDALNAFQLANSTGKELDKTDLLAATLQVAWGNIPLREQLPNRIRDLNQRFHGNNPIRKKNYLNIFVQSSMGGLHAGYRWSDLTPDVINHLRGYWGDFQNNYVLLVEQLSRWGMTRSKCVSATNALLPILAIQVRKNFQFGMENNAANIEIEKVRQWLLVVLLNRTFGGQSTLAVRDALRVIDEHGQQTYFPKDELFSELAQHHTSDFRTRDGVARFIDALTYGRDALQIRQLLMLLKDNIQAADITKYEIDHIFPRQPYANQHPDNIHKVWNLQLLTSLENNIKDNQTPAILYQDENFSPEWRQKNLLPENDETVIYNIWDDPNRLWRQRREWTIDTFCRILNVE